MVPHQVSLLSQLISVQLPPLNMMLSAGLC